MGPKLVSNIKNIDNDRLIHSIDNLNVTLQQILGELRKQDKNNCFDERIAIVKKLKR